MQTSASSTLLAVLSIDAAPAHTGGCDGLWGVGVMPPAELRARREAEERTHPARGKPKGLARIPRSVVQQKSHRGVARGGALVSATLFGVQINKFAQRAF
jgi:hypothetical protein